ncbi:hypothetical protein KY290_031440 [Solanum tuberosum]|uniref:Retrotransposon Copia-like N-terminal domain-containing protein n=1 Tax=Solanum tuberosum TaxID=4113 RepID=A0ABQ7UAY0_SOLTU|nr:hypothetical protein KY289_030832 [Solanum tuberosum]KAH0743447.1 hypothetical protein KY290_031440 [Solanum tuberosum]
MQASDTPSTILVPTQLTGAENYGLCSRSMRIALLGKGKLGFMNGVCKREAQGTELRNMWDKCDAICMNQMHIQYGRILRRDSTRLKELWDEYDMIVPMPSCGCDILKDYVEHLQEQRLLQFLAGLNDSYDHTRRQILIKIVAPSVNQAYAMIIEVESDQSIGTNSANHNQPDPLAMSFGRGRGHAYQGTTGR